MFVSNLFTHGLSHVALTDVVVPKVPGLLTEVSKPALKFTHNRLTPALMKGLYNVATTCESDFVAEKILAPTIGALDVMHKHNVAGLIEKIV